MKIEVPKWVLTFQKPGVSWWECRLEAQSQTSRVGDRSRWFNWRIEIDEASLYSWSWSACWFFWIQLTLLFLKVTKGTTTPTWTSVSINYSPVSGILIGDFNSPGGNWQTFKSKLPADFGIHIEKRGRSPQPSSLKKSLCRFFPIVPHCLSMNALFKKKEKKKKVKEK